MYMVMLMPVSAVAMPMGPMLTELSGAGAGAERANWRRERSEREMDFMVVRIFGGVV